MNLEYGFLLFVIGCTSTFVGFFLAYIIANKVIMKKNIKREISPLDDLNKNMPGSKAGDDCQWVSLQREHLTF